MIIINPNDVAGHVTPPPYVRNLKLLVSPLLQQEIKDISIGMTILQPGCKSSSHTHEKETETWVILEGKGAVIVGEKRHEVEPNNIIVIPPLIEHQLENTSNQTFKVLWIYTPPGPELAVLNKVHY
jgi:mannose-6-phosphate isomerase-like protein (cupin superfamily)